MNRTTLFILVFIAALIGLGGWAYSKWSAYAPTVYVQESTENGTTTQTTIDTAAGTQTKGAPTFTLAEVKAHNTKESCYTIISGKVYDLTLWVALHPGGKEPILSLCGIDGTQKFIAKHKGAQKQMDVLARFFIGTLAEASAAPNTPTKTEKTGGSIPSGTLCTMDAYQCPDGTWVGRSGPNCQFVCP